MTEDYINENEINLLQSLGHVSNNKISDLFHGIDFNVESITLLCHDIMVAIDKFIGQPQDCLDLSDDLSVQFLKKTLPIFIEIFLHRKNLRCFSFLLLLLLLLTILNLIYYDYMYI
jgi:hypothetical protein